MTRLEWFKKQADFSKMLDHIRVVDFDEFVVNRYGDVCVYRVYGNNENNFKMYERQKNLSFF